MTYELERMIVRLIGDGSSYFNMINRAQSQTVGLTTALTAAAGVTTGVGAALKALSLASQREQSEISFGVLLQNMDLGKQLVNDLRDFAAATPLNTPEIQQATKTLLQYGAVSNNTVIPTLRMIGDVTGGNADKFTHMAYAFGQTAAAGRLMGQDLLQMVNAGFNPLQEISRTTGKSVAFLRHEMEGGRISVEMVANAMKTATSEGGRYFQYLERQSKSLYGLWSTLKDDVWLTLSVLGDEMIETFNMKKAVTALSSGAGAIAPWISLLGESIRSIGFYWRRYFTDSSGGIADFVNRFIENNKKLITTVVLVIAVMVALKVAMLAAALAISLVSSLLAILQLKQLIHIGIWLATATAIGVAKLAIFLFNAQIVLFNLLIGIATGAVSVFSLALTGLIILVAAVGTINVMAVVIGAIGGALWGVSKSLSSVVDLLMTLPSAYGPIRVITELFGGWAKMLKDVANIAKTDVQGAFEVLRAGFAVALSEIQDLWTPLWQFIKDGSLITWNAIKFNFVVSFIEGLTIAFC